MRCWASGGDLPDRRALHHLSACHRPPSPPQSRSQTTCYTPSRRRAIPGRLGSPSRSRSNPRRPRAVPSGSGSRRSETCSSICRATARRRAPSASSSAVRRPPSSWRCGRSRAAPSDVAGCGPSSRPSSVTTPASSRRSSSTSRGSSGATRLARAWWFRARPRPATASASRRTRRRQRSSAGPARWRHTQRPRVSPRRRSLPWCGSTAMRSPRRSSRCPPSCGRRSACPTGPPR